MTQHRPSDGAWGVAASDWATIQERTLHPLFVTVLDWAAVGPGTHVLDVACGTGLFCMLAADRGAIVAGLDASPGQLAVARERLPATDLREGDMEALPFAPSAFDLVTCCNALQYAQDPVRALTEMRRVTRPAGLVGIMTHSLTGPQATGTTFATLFQFQPAPEPERPALAIFRQPGALEGFLVAAGLTTVADAEVACDWDYSDLETALRGILSSAPGIRAIRLAGPESVREALTTALAPYRTSTGGYRLPRLMRYVLTRS